MQHKDRQASSWQQENWICKSKLLHLQSETFHLEYYNSADNSQNWFHSAFSAVCRINTLVRSIGNWLWIWIVNTRWNNYRQNIHSCMVVLLHRFLLQNFLTMVIYPKKSRCNNGNHWNMPFTYRTSEIIPRRWLRNIITYMEFIQP